MRRIDRLDIPVGAIWRGVRGNWLPLTISQAVFKGVAALLVTPLTVALIGALLSRSGAIAAVNFDLVGFALSLWGALAVLLLPTIALSVAFTEQAFTLALIDTEQKRRRDRLLEATKTTLACLPRLAGLALLQVAAGVALALPFAGVAGLTCWALLSGADVNYHLDARTPRFVAAVIIGAVLVLTLAALLLSLYARWFFAVAVCVYDGRRPMACLRRSAAIARGRRWRIVAAAGGWLLLRAATLALVVALLTGLDRAVLWAVGDRLTVGLWAMAGLLAVNAAVLAVGAAVDRAGFAALVCAMYRQVRPRTTATTSPVAAVQVFEAAEASPRWLRPRLALAAGLVLAAGVAASSNAALLAGEAEERRRVLVTAHRAGALYAPENSLAALQLAIDARADYAEIDIQLSADGTPWVLHDRDLRRVAGLPVVLSRARDAELAAVDIGSRFDPRFAGEPLATLDAFIEAARGRIRLSVELKYYGFDPRLAEVVVDRLRTHGITGEANIISLDMRGLQQIRELDPTIPRGLLVTATLGDPTRLDVDFLSVQRALLTPALRGRADARGQRLAVWTLNDRDSILAAILAGADEIVTDDPALAAEVIDWFDALPDLQRMLLRFRQTLR